MKLSINTSAIQDKPVSGILYVLEIELEDRLLVKVGVTTRRIEDRVCEILASIWKRYRVFPKCYVKRFTKVDNLYEKETYMHRQLNKWSYTTQYSFSGSTEIFAVELDQVVVLYDELISKL